MESIPEPFPGAFEDIGHRTITLVVCLTTISTICMVIRIWSRAFVLKKFGLDDTFAGLAYVLLVAQAGVELSSVRYGQGRHIAVVPPANLKTFFVLLPTMQLIYLAGTGLVRMSIVAFLPRINKSDWFIHCVIALGLGIAITAATFFFVFLFQCKPVIGLWYRSPTTVCISPSAQAYIIYTHAAFGILFDLILLAIPLYMVYTNMNWSKMTVKVLLTFSVGVFAFITGIIRLNIIVTVDMAADITWNLVRGASWSDVEFNVGFWVACFPTFPPIYRLLAFKLGLRADPDPSKRTASNSTPNTVFSTAPRQRRGRRESQRVGSQEDISELFAMKEIEKESKQIVKSVHVEVQSTHSRDHDAQPYRSYETHAR